MSEIFGGSHFVLVGEHILDFLIFLFRNQKRMPRVTHLSRGQNMIIYKDAVAGGP